MNITEYVNSFPRRERMKVRRNIACAIGVSEVYIRHMCNGQRPIPGAQAIPIERATNGLVPRATSCPTLYPQEEITQGNITHA